MILSFGDKATREFFKKGKSRKIPPDVQRRAYRKRDLPEKLCNYSATSSTSNLTFIN